MSSNPRNPLVLTLTLDKSSQHFLTSLRSKYFPKHRNFLNAHVTLFHAIPPHRRSEFEQELSSLANSVAPWDVFIGDPKKMGKKGVMVTVRDRPARSTEEVHRRLLQFLQDGVKEDKDKLTEQDSKHGGRPHVTILNKAEKEEEVEDCLEELLKLFDGMKGEKEQFGQQKGTAIGLEL